MKQPLTTLQVVKMFPHYCDESDSSCDCVEGSTCSNRCSVCGSRIWFKGSWCDEDTPEKFACPYCGVIQINPYPYSTQAERLKKLESETPKRYCWNCKHGGEWCDTCINYSGWEPLNNKQEPIEASVGF